MKKIKLILLAIGFLPLLFTGVSKASAVQKGIQISPLSFNLTVNENQSKNGYIIIKNLYDDPINYICETENFTQVSDDGAPSFLSVAPQKGVTTLADWVQFIDPKEGTLQPGKDTKINFNINIPAGAEPGGHYGAVFAKVINKTPDGKTQLGVSSRVGALMLITVPGDVKKSAELSNFTTPKFLWRGPLALSMKATNTGTVHYDSQGTVSIKSMFGKTTKVSMGKHTLIPKNSRNYSGTWTNKYPFGYYKLTASILDGDGKAVTAEQMVCAIPLLIVIPAIAGIILLILLINYLRKHLKFQ